MQMDKVFTPWVRRQLLDDKYVGLFVEDAQAVVAGAGVFFSDFPPHWRHTEAVRAYVLNVYTKPAYRGLGLAKMLTKRLLEESQRRGVTTVVLHASPQGRPIYEALRVRSKRRDDYEPSHDTNGPLICRGSTLVE